MTVLYHYLNSTLQLPEDESIEAYRNQVWQIVFIFSELILSLVALLFFMLFLFFTFRTFVFRKNDKIRERNKSSLTIKTGMFLLLGFALFSITFYFVFSYGAMCLEIMTGKVSGIGEVYSAETLNKSLDVLERKMHSVRTYPFLAQFSFLLANVLTVIGGCYLLKVFKKL
ncbi:MAG: hypothetical protein PHE89_07895 [Alphaproteobacteria bacterium]|nr:hypothetical protein [Alphaproteobacteria bacterium]